MQTLYLQNQQVAGDNYRGLYLVYDKVQEIAAEEKLHGLGLDKSLGACVGLYDDGEDNAADPDCKDRVEWGHCRAVVFYRVDRGDAGLHYLRKILTVDHGASAEQVNEHRKVVLVGRNVIKLLKRLRQRGDNTRGGGLQGMQGIVQRGLCALDCVTQQKRVVIELADAVQRRGNVQEYILDGLGQLLRAGDEVIRKTEDGIDYILTVAHGLLNIVSVRQGVEPFAEVIEIIRYLLRQSLGLRNGDIIAGEGVAPVAHLVAHGYRVRRGLLDRLLRGLYCLGIAGVDRILKPVKGGLNLFKRLVNGNIHLGNIVAYLVALGELGVEVGNYPVKHGAVDRDIVGVSRAELIERMLGGLQGGQRLLEHDMQRLAGIILGYLIGDEVCLLHDAAYENLKIVLVYTALERLRRRVGYLCRNGVFLRVFVVGYLGLAVPLGQHIIHAVREVLVNDDGGIVIAGVHAVDGLLLAVRDDPVYRGAFAQVCYNIIALVDLFAAVGHIALIHRGHGNRNIARIAVGVPVGIDIEPCVQTRQDHYGYRHNEGEEMPADGLDVPSEDFEYVSHNSSVPADKYSYTT